MPILTYSAILGADQIKSEWLAQPSPRELLITCVSAFGLQLLEQVIIYFYSFMYVFIFSISCNFFLQILGDTTSLKIYRQDVRGGEDNDNNDDDDNSPTVIFSPTISQKDAQKFLIASIKCCKMAKNSHTTNCQRFNSILENKVFQNSKL